MSQQTKDGARTVNGVEAPPAGTYEIDPSHSAIEAVGRHLMVTKVRGRFNQFSGTITLADDPLESSVHVTVDAASLDSGDEKRDAHLRSADFLAVDEHPTIEFHSTRLDPSGRRWNLEGDLTLRGVTRPVSFDVTYEGAVTDPWGNDRIAFSASAEIDREDWGLTWNVALETGGLLVGKKIALDLSISAVRKD